ncbi:hypothetical protein ACTXT7_016796 [Hymenolepis weldensis]
MEFFNLSSPTFTIYKPKSRSEKKKNHNPWADSVFLRVDKFYIQESIQMINADSVCFILLFVIPSEIIHQVINERLSRSPREQLSPPIATSFIWKVRNELLNENGGDELATTRKRKEHCQLSAHSLRTPELVRKVHGMMDKNRGKSIRDILLKAFKCLKEQQHIRNAIH